MLVFNSSNSLNTDGYNLRVKTFVEEQGFAMEIEINDNEDDYIHCYLYKESILVGYLRYIVNNEIVHIGRVCVDKDYRGNGIGSLLFMHIENELSQKGYKNIEIHSQLRAKAFYQKCGYKEIGNIFLEDEVQHIKMIKELKK